jgi:5-methyltetrahydropteroyltriglutamate--homocysteine methyltransferase
MVMATGYHAEHVGSLLRPPELLEARAAHARGEIGTEQLREAEDRAALAALDVQRQAGIKIFTDGEVRRANWMAGLLEALGGVVEQPPAPGVKWHGDDEDPPDEETAFVMVTVTDKLYQKGDHTSVEAAFLAKHAPGQYKITMMSCAQGTIMWQPGVSEKVYPTPLDMMADLVALQTKEIEGLIDQGVSWIQLDSLSYNQVIDPEFRQQIGIPPEVTPESLLDAAIAVDTQLVRAAKAKNPDVTIAMHFCRGNNRSAWMAEGGYDMVAERLFNEVGVDRFLLEYESERSGGFEPLRFMPDGPAVVLGLVSSKLRRLESPDDLRRRIDEAAKYVPIDNLALSPQCGFASTALGNLLTPDDQRRKLELVVSTAERIWG